MPAMTTERVHDMNESDQALVARMRAGEDDAFASVYQQLSRLFAVK